MALIIWITIGWHLGIFGGRLLPPQPGILWAGASLVALAAAFALRRYARVQAGLVLVMFAALGAWRYQATQPTIDEGHLAYYNDGEDGIRLTGVIIGEPDRRDRHTNLQVRVTEMRRLDEDGDFAEITLREGVMQLTAPHTEAFAFGDRIQAFGLLQTPPSFEDFDYAAYLARQGVHSTLRRTTITNLGPADCTDLPDYGWWDCTTFTAQRHLFAFKERALTVIKQLFPEPQGALLSGILLGVESGIPAWLQADFRTTGTSHIVAISGFNISIIATVIVRLLAIMMPQRRARWLAVVVVAIYTILAGADGSVVRSAIMAGLLLLTGGLSRGGRSNGIYALTTAAVIMTFANPLWLWDLGFQLSVAATLGLIVYADPFTAVLARWLARYLPEERARKWADALSEITTITLAAQLMVTPLLAYYFHEISIVSLLANVIVLPVQPAVMILSGLATIAGLIWLPLGQLLAWATWPFVTFTIQAVKLLARIPGGVMPLPLFSWQWLVIAYGGLATVTHIMSRPSEARPRWWRLVARRPSLNAWIALFGVAAIMGWQSLLSIPDGRLHVRYLNVGDGQATLIQTPGGRYILIDGGPSPNRLAEQIGALPLNRRILDLVIVTSTETGHIGGLTGLFNRVDIGQVVMLAEPGESRDYRAWLEGLNEREIETHTHQPGDWLAYDLRDGVRLDVLSSGQNRVLLRLTWGDASFLFAPDLDAEDSAALVNLGQVSRSTVMLMPGQGEEDTLDPAFLSRANPWAAVLSVSPANPNGAPDRATLALFDDPQRVLRTDKLGWIEFATDGERLWAFSER